MTKMMTIPAARVHAVIADGIAAALKARGYELSPDLLVDLGRSASDALAELDESLVAAEEPSMADRLAVGETLRSLAMMGRPNAEVARALDRVGSWLTRTAKAELKIDVEAA